MDLAALGLTIDGTGAIRTLNRFTHSAHNAGRATEHLERTTKNLTASLRILGGYFGVRQLVEYADTWTLINARIKLVTESTEQAAVVQRRLYQIAQQTRNTLAATSVLYTRVALNADQLGRSHDELLTVVESVNAAMLLSGATGVEAAQAMRQFAQALGSGRVQGDEFRTMIEAMPLVARAIADEMGVAFGDLYKLSAEGLIDVQTVIDALIDKNEELTTRSQAMNWTVGQSFEYVINKITQVIGVVNMYSESTATLARWMRALADHMEKVIAAIGALVAAFVAYRIALAGVWALTQLMLAARTLRMWWELVRAIRSLADMMYLVQNAAKGLAGVITTIAALTIGFVAYRKLLAEITDATNEWMSAQADLSGALGEGADRIDEKTQKALQQMEDMVREAHQEIVLASMLNEELAKQEIRFDAINKRVEARRELQGDLLRQMLAAIDLEEQLLLKAVDVEAAMEKAAEATKEHMRIIRTFLRDFQRSFAETLYQIFDRGIASFQDFFDAIKKMFFRLLADMLAAKLMQRVSGQLATLVGVGFGSSAEALSAQQGAQSAYEEARTHLGPAGATVPDTVPVKIEGITNEATQNWSATVARYLGPVLAGFGIGSMIGGMTSNRALGAGGGALGGAAAGAMVGSFIPGVGTAVGAVAGGLAGALGGFLSSSKRLAEEMERNRIAIEANTRRLDDMRNTLEGTPNSTLLMAYRSHPIFQRLNPAVSGTPADYGQLNASMQLLMQRAAEELGIQILDDDGKYIAGSLDQLAEAINLAIRSITDFANTLQDARRRQDAYNQLFDIEQTPMQQLQDSLSILNQLSPQLVEQFGLGGLDLTTGEGRSLLLQGIQDIFLAIESGFFTANPQLLGAFTDKNQLLDAILRVKDGLDEFDKQLQKVTTDFPRAMDIVYYEQLYGRFGTSGRGGLDDPGYSVNTGTPGSGNGRFVVHGNVVITNESGDTGEDILKKLEEAIAAKDSVGGYIELQPDENSF